MLRATMSSAALPKAARGVRAVALSLGITLCSGACSVDAGRAPSAGAVSACRFELSASVSAKIATVGVVEWSSELGAIDDAHIEFGLDTSYGMTAPVDLDEPNHRTLLLGMKGERTYHFRIVADTPDGECTSDDHELETGPIANGLPKLTVTTVPGATPEARFLVSCFLDGPAFILDADGDYVWVYGSGEMGRVAFSHDGKHVYIGGINLAGGNASMRRVTLDGSSDEDLSSEFGDLHHDFTVLPDETVAFIEHDGDLDRVVEHAPDGTERQVFVVADAEGGATRNHANSIHYSPDDDSYTVSDLFQDAYVNVTREGEVLWVLGGPTSDFDGDGADWTDEHGHELLAPDRLLFFDNEQVGHSSAAVEVSLDFSSMTATRVWQYAPGDRSQFYGDVERLDGGNTLVTFSTAGTLHEVDANGELVRKLTWDIGGVPGYVTERASLYGPP